MESRALTRMLSSGANISNANNVNNMMDEFVLYQQNPTKQILLHDMATSSAVLTFLKMHSIDCSIRNQTNTEFMSENGRLPVVLDKHGDKIMCGFKEVFWHILRKSNYKPHLLELAYIDWIETQFLEAEMYICWCHEPVLNEYTKNRYMQDLPWPVATILFNRKKTKIQSTVGKKFEDFKDFLSQFTQFLTQLSKLIGNRPFVLNEPRASAVNALIYGHANAILSTKLHPKLVEAITWQKKICNLVKLMDELYPS